MFSDLQENTKKCQQVCKTSHNNSPEFEMSKDPHNQRPRHPCKFSQCAKTFATKRGAGNHFRIQHAENPVRFFCTLCPKQFKTRDNLTSHIFSHTKEKSVKCPTCGRAFPTLHNLKNHEVKVCFNQVVQYAYNYLILHLVSGHPYSKIWAKKA